MVEVTLPAAPSVRSAKSRHFSIQSDGETLRVGESRSSLDPRGMEWSDSQSNRSTRITQNTRSEERDSISRKDETYRHSMPGNGQRVLVSE